MFAITLFLPFRDRSEYIENSTGIIGIKESFVYFFEAPIIFVLYASLFGLVSISILTLNKRFVIIAGISSILLLLILFILSKAALNFSGGPHQANLQYGYWINQAVIVTIIILGFIWSDRLVEARKKGKHSELDQLIDPANK